MNQIIQRKFKKFSIIVERLCTKAEIPKYFRYVQKKTYNNQHIYFYLQQKNIPMWDKVKHLDFDYFVADKGYDSETNHKAVFQAGKQSLISLKHMNLPSHRTRGEYRKKAKREFEHGLYT